MYIYSHLRHWDLVLRSRQVRDLFDGLKIYEEVAKGDGWQ